MKHAFKFIAPMLAMAILLCGCPYKSAVPLDAPSVKVKKELLGKWEGRDDKTETIVISAKDDFSYRVVRTSGTNKPEEFAAYLSDVDGQWYVNMKSVDENAMSGDSYFFYRLKLMEQRIVLDEVTENIREEFTASPDLKAFFKQHQKLSFFFSKTGSEYLRTGN